jgi:hypothetical protein
MSASIIADQDLPGLAQLQALIDAGRMPGIGRSMNFTLVEVEEGRAVFEGVPGAHVYNPLGVVHGGYAATRRRCSIPPAAARCTPSWRRGKRTPRSS